MSDVPPPVRLSFDYGRLTLPDRFIKLSNHDVDFTLNFDKKIFTPEDDMVLTLYVANYTEDSLQFALETPIVSRQQLIHASLTYGENGEYAVPVTVDFTEEADLAGGAYDVSVRNRKLIATTVTFHTSAYENIEESIFNRDFADTYEMRFWFGEDEYVYCVEPKLLYEEISWDDPTQLQSLEFPESLVHTVGNVCFTLSFERPLCGTDDDVRVHIKVENTGREPLVLRADSDISDPLYYIRAELTYGNLTPVRDNVSGASEIAGIESQHMMKYQDVLERDIVFYTSEFTNIARSVYSGANRDKCLLKVWIMVEGQICEVTVPITYAEYFEYSYHGRDLPEIKVSKPVFTTTEPPQAEIPAESENVSQNDSNVPTE